MMDSPPASPPPLPSFLHNHLSFSFLPFVLLRNFAVVRTQTCMYLFTSCVSGLHFQRDESGAWLDLTWI
jgi:hypothetical protein